MDLKVSIQTASHLLQEAAKLLSFSCSLEIFSQERAAIVLGIPINLKHYIKF